MASSSVQVNSAYQLPEQKATGQLELNTVDSPLGSPQPNLDLSMEGQVLVRSSCGIGFPLREQIASISPNLLQLRIRNWNGRRASLVRPSELAASALDIEESDDRLRQICRGKNAA